MAFLTISLSWFKLFRSQKKLLIFYKSALLEIGIFLIAAVAFDYLFASNERFFFVSPHPFWVLVLFITIQYGTNEGLLAAFCSTIALFSGKIPPQTVLQDHFEYIVFLIKNPILWCVSSVFIGEARMRQIHERDDLRLNIVKIEERDKVISQTYEGLKKAKEQIEVTLASEMISTIKAYRKLQNLSHSPREEVLQNLDTVINSMLQPKKFSIFEFSNQNLNLVKSIGWEQTDTFAKTFDKSHALNIEMKKNESTISVINPQQREILTNEGICATPIYDPDSLKSVGMIKIEDAPLNFLKPTTFELLNLLSPWVGNIYMKNTYKMLDDKGQLEPQEFKEKNFILQLAHQFNFSLSDIVISSLDQQYFEKKHAKLLEYIQKFLKKRRLSFATEIGDNRLFFTIPINLSQAYQLKSEIEEILDVEGLLSPQLQIEAISLYEKSDALDA